MFTPIVTKTLMVCVLGTDIYIDTEWNIGVISILSPPLFGRDTNGKSVLQNYKYKHIHDGLLKLRKRHVITINKMCLSYLIYACKVFPCETKKTALGYLLTEYFIHIHAV